MSLGSWDPKIEARSTELLLESDLLRRLIAYSHEEQLAQLEQLLNANDKQRLAGLMKIDPLIWQTAAEPLLENDLLHLIRFFAVAENLPGWEAGATSPVIPLAKIPIPPQYPAAFSHMSGSLFLRPAATSSPFAHFTFSTAPVLVYPHSTTHLHHYHTM